MIFVYDTYMYVHMHMHICICIYVYAWHVCIYACMPPQVKEAKKYYPLFGMFANVALVFSGQFVRYVSQMKVTLTLTPTLTLGISST